VARPKKTGQKRKVRVVVYLTQDEAEQLKTKSEKMDKAMSDILRDAWRNAS
jgi:hypothetical protein